MSDSFLIMFVHNMSNKSQTKLAKIVYLNLNYNELAIFTTVNIKSSIPTKYFYNNGEGHSTLKSHYNTKCYNLKEPMYRLLFDPDRRNVNK